jgi:hypothetical protein
MFYLQWNLTESGVRYGVLRDDYQFTWTKSKEKATRFYQNSAEAWLKTLRGQDVAMKYEGTHEEVRVPVVQR